MTKIDDLIELVADWADYAEYPEVDEITDEIECLLEIEADFMRD